MISFRKAIHTIAITLALIRPDLALAQQIQAGIEFTDETTISFQLQSDTDISGQLLSINFTIRWPAGNGINVDLMIPYSFIYSKVASGTGVDYQGAQYDFAQFFYDTSTNRPPLELLANTPTELLTLTVTGQSMFFLAEQDFEGTATDDYYIQYELNGSPDPIVGIPPGNLPYFQQEASNVVSVTPTATDDAETTDEDTSSLIDVLQNDIDPGGGGLSIDRFTQGSNGTVTQEGNQLRYIPNDDFNGSDSFSYTISNIDSNTDDGTVTVTVTAVNDPPSFQKGSNQSIVENTGSQSVANWATNISAGPPNESGQTLTFNLSTNNDALFATPPTLDASGTLTYEPATDASGQAEITVILQDDGGTANGGQDTSEQQTFNISISSAPNNVPEAVDDEAATNEDTALQVNAPGVLENDTDADGETLTVELVTGPSNGDLTLNPDGSYEYTPDTDFNGSDSFEYKANDGTDDSNTATVTLTINAVNDAPAFTSTPPTGAAGNELYSYLLEAEDVDGDQVIFTGITLPDWLTLVNQGDGTAVLEGTPTNTDLGEHDVVLEAGDGLATVEQAFVLTVTEGIPGVPVPVAPNDGGIEIAHPVLLSWNSVPGASSYDVQVSTTGDFSNPVVDTLGVVDTSVSISDLQNGATYFWRVRAANGAGFSDYSVPSQFTTVTGVASEEEGTPGTFWLGQNYPNPFHASTSITYAIAEPAHVRLAVYDTYGRTVKVLVDRTQATGRYVTGFGAGNLATGIYIIRMEAGSFEAMKTILLVR